MSFGDQIKRLRNAAGLTQAELSAKSGVSQSYLARIELNQVHEIAAAFVFRLAAALDVDVNTFRDSFVPPIAAVGAGAGDAGEAGEPVRVISKRK